MTTKNISRNKGCRLLVIEPVHCGPSSIRLLTFFGTPCICIFSLFFFLFFPFLFFFFSFFFLFFLFVFVLWEEEEVQSVQSEFICLLLLLRQRCDNSRQTQQRPQRRSVGHRPDSAINYVFLYFPLNNIYTTTIDNDDTNAKTETFERQIQLQCEIISTRTLLWLQIRL